MPLIALSPQGIDPGMRLLMSRKALREMTDGNRRLYAALAGSVTRGEHRALEGARHSTIHIDRSDAVVQAIRELLDRIEKGVVRRHVMNLASEPIAEAQRISITRCVTRAFEMRPSPL